MRAFRLACLFGLLLCSAHLPAWQDPFDAWSVSGRLQLLEINRPTGGLPPYGSLDGFGESADGYTRDGLWLRFLDLSLAGPLGWRNWSAVLESQVTQGNASLADFYARWDSGAGVFKLGQAYLPFGVEQQTSTRDLVGIQRGLMYGFEDYGSPEAWGLELMNQRGWGLRWDRAWGSGPLRLIVQAAADEFSGGYLYQDTLGAVDRFAVAWDRDAWSLQLGYSTLLGRAHWETPPSEFAPLGAAQGAPQIAAADLAGAAPMQAWGPDAQGRLGPLHGQAEMAAQTIGGHLRGGGQAVLSLDGDGLLEALGFAKRWRRAYVYVGWSQAFTRFGDGVHQPDSLYRSTTYGVRLPLGWDPASLKLESVQVSNDAFGGVLPDGRIEQAQLEVQF